MTFSDTKDIPKPTLPCPREGDRICEACLPVRVALEVDTTKAGHVFRCPRCHNYERWNGLRAMKQPELNL